MLVLCPHCHLPFERIKQKLIGTKMQRLNQQIFIAPNGCWLWLGGLGKRGYPHFSWQGKTLYAHRVSWELHKGTIPKNTDVCHNCPDGDNPLCVNPDHLFLGTHAENMQDMLRKGRRRCWGEKARTAKLTEGQVLAIRSKRMVGLSEQELANEYGVLQTTISQIVLGKSWKHLLSERRMAQHA